MSVGLLGTKLGMTQVFDKEGNAVPVTVIQAGPCTITQIKTLDRDGYAAIQVGFGTTRAKLLTQPELGHLKASSTEPVKHLQEYRVADTGSYQLGQQLDVNIFQEGTLVDAIGTSIGRGFAGNQKRNHFGRGPMAHGSKNHRQPGSIGAGTTPGRVYPGKRMAGRLGGKRCTVKKLIIVKVDPEKNLLLVKGAVPGKAGGLVNIVPAKVVGQTK